MLINLGQNIKEKRGSFYHFHIYTFCLVIGKNLSLMYFSIKEHVDLFEIPKFFIYTCTGLSIHITLFCKHMFCCISQKFIYKRKKCLKNLFVCAL